MMFLVFPATIDAVPEQGLDPERAAVGELVAAIRQTRQLSPTELARRAEVDVKTVRSLENGTRWPQDVTRVKLERVLGLGPGVIGEFLASEQARIRAWGFLRSGELRGTWEPPADGSSTTKVDASGLARLLQIKAKPIEDRTPEEQAFVMASDARRDQLAAASRRAAEEEPLVDLVEAGQLLLQQISDNRVQSFVRKVESYVVGEVGIDRLTTALDARATEKMVVRANERGMLEDFVHQVDRLRAAGIEGPELMRRAGAWLDVALASSPKGADMVDEIKAGLLAMADRVEADSEKLSTCPNYEAPPRQGDVDLARRLARQGYQKGRGDQEDTSQEGHG